MKMKSLVVLMLLLCVPLSGCAAVKAVDQWVQDHLW